MEVIERVLEVPDIPLNCIEGFIRQIIGWREFILQAYLMEGETERRRKIKKDRKGLYRRPSLSFFVKVKYRVIN